MIETTIRTNTAANAVFELPGGRFVRVSRTREDSADVWRLVIGAIIVRMDGPDLRALVSELGLVLQEEGFND